MKFFDFSSRFNKGKNWRETYVMHENTQQQHRKPRDDTIFKTKNRPLIIHKGVSFKNYKKSLGKYRSIIAES